MSRRKSEITGHMNERDFPHLVELALPPGGIRDQSLEFNAFHHECGIPIRRGRVRHEVEQFHVRFCFPDAATADAFRERFGGTLRSSALAVFRLMTNSNVVGNWTGRSAGFAPFKI